MATVGVIGASGFTGAELLRLLAQHPELELVVATGDTQAGTAVASLFPSLAAAYPGLEFAPSDSSTLAACAGLDLVFCALPHGASQQIVPGLLAGSATVVDLAADFRLVDPADYAQWYGEDHTVPELLGDAVYGLPEMNRERIAGARLIAAPGCYPTAASLAMAPLLERRIAAPTGIIVDAASGVSGAGRPPKPGTTFAAVDANFVAYGLLDHRHTPEIEQNLAGLAGMSRGECQVLFTPHLAPMSRGILATCYLRPVGDLPTTDELLNFYRDRFDAEPFVVVGDVPPATKSTLGSNVAHVSVVADPRTGWIVAMAAIDNLVKGASGQAVQCANLALGLEETLGLTSVGVFP